MLGGVENRVDMERCIKDGEKDPIRKSVCQHTTNLALLTNNPEQIGIGACATNCSQDFVD
jgi:hypothetical protein